MGPTRDDEEKSIIVSSHKGANSSISGYRRRRRWSRLNRRSLIQQKDFYAVLIQEERGRKEHLYNITHTLQLSEEKDADTDVNSINAGKHLFKVVNDFDTRDSLVGHQFQSSFEKLRFYDEPRMLDEKTLRGLVRIN